jgi:hypothetical protein
VWRQPAVGKRWLVPILWVAFGLRLLWLFAPGYEIDVRIIVSWMRAAAQGGIVQTFANTGANLYLPLAVYLLNLIGLFSPSVVQGAPPLASELLILRLSIIAADLVTVAVLYVIGHRIAGVRAGLVAALLYAISPAGVYLSGWYVQLDAWFVLPLLLAAWWLARGRVGLAWLAFGLSLSVKWQAAVVLPVFVVGTWRWWGLRPLIRGIVIAGVTAVLLAAPLLFNGRASDLVSKTVATSDRLTLDSHNVWFATVPAARDPRRLNDASRDGNACLAGVSCHDVGLAMLAIAYAVILARLWVRSGPRSVFAATAAAYLAFFTLPTRIDIRHMFPALACMVAAGLLDRRWWVLYGAASITLLVNLIWRSLDASPLWDVLPVSVAGATMNAWVNVAAFCAAMVLLVLPALPDSRRIAAEGPLHFVRGRWERILVGAGTFVLIGGIAVVFWRGREMGLQVARVAAPMRTSMSGALGGVTSADRVVIVNWPRVLSSDRSANLGIVPIVPPAQFMDGPYEILKSAIWLQFRPWQTTLSSLGVEYWGDEILEGDLIDQVKQADRVISLDAPAKQMIVLAQRLPSAPASTCPADFGGVCLRDGQTVRKGDQLQLTFTWQVNGAVPPDATVFVHVLALDGKLVAQADGDPAANLMALSDWPEPGVALRETRFVTLTESDYTVRVGLYNRGNGERWPVHCSSTATCAEDAVVIQPATDSK